MPILRIQIPQVHYDHLMTPVSENFVRSMINIMSTVRELYDVPVVITVSDDVQQAKTRNSETAPRLT